SAHAHCAPPAGTSPGTPAGRPSARPLNRVEFSLDSADPLPREQVQGQPLADGGIFARHQPNGNPAKQATQGHVRRPAGCRVEVVVKQMISCGRSRSNMRLLRSGPASRHWPARGRAPPPGARAPGVPRVTALGRGRPPPPEEPPLTRAPGAPPDPPRRPPRRGGEPVQHRLHRPGPRPAAAPARQYPRIAQLERHTTPPGVPRETLTAPERRMPTPGTLEQQASGPCRAWVRWVAQAARQDSAGNG